MKYFLVGLAGGALAVACCILLWIGLVHGYGMAVDYFQPGPSLDAHDPALRIAAAEAAAQKYGGKPCDKK